MLLLYRHVEVSFYVFIGIIYIYIYVSLYLVCWYYICMS